MGLNRSKERLYNEFVRRGRAGEDVPTRRKQDIADWSREFNWDDRIRERERQQMEYERERISEQRTRYIDNLTLLLDSSITALVEIIENLDGQTPPHVRLKAVEMVADRLNIKGVEEPTKKREQRVSVKPPKDPEKLLQWHAEYGHNNIGGE